MPEINKLTVKNDQGVDVTYDIRDSSVAPEIESINERIDEIEYEQNGIFAIAKNINYPNAGYVMMYSEDGEHFNQVGSNLPSSFANDASSVCEINGYYYHIQECNYRVSKDLKNWSDRKVIIEGGSASATAPYVTGWGTMFYYDEVHNQVYAYYACSYNEETVLNAAGNSTRYFKLSYQVGEQQPNGDIIFDQTVHDLLYVDGESYIDPFVINDSKAGLLIAYKNEITCKIHISDMSSLDNIGTTTKICPIAGIEAPKLINDEHGNVICYFDGYQIGNKTILNNTEAYLSYNGYFYVAVNGEMRNDYHMGCINTFYPCQTRHAGYCKVSDKMYHDILKLGIKSFPTFSAKTVVGVNQNGKEYITPADGSTIVNFPNVIYILAGTKTLNIKPYFRDQPLRFVLRNGANITWGQDSWVQSWTRGFHLEGNSAREFEYFEMWPDGRNILDGLYPCIKR